MTSAYVFCPIIKTHACRNLWRNVIHLALADATDQITANALNQSKALAWIERGGKDFILVCEMADYSPRYVREKLKVMLEKRSLSRKKHHMNKMLKTVGELK